jgi:hypothetical protein
MKRYSQKVSVLLLATLVSCNNEDSFYQQEALNSLAQNNEEIITLSNPTGGEELPPAAQPPAGNPPVIIPEPPVVVNPPVVIPQPPVVIPPVIVVPDNDLCIQNPSAPACIVAPIAKKPSVATILLTLSQVEPNAAQLIAVNIVKQVSEVLSPKILFLEDSNLRGEDPNDVLFVHLLLQGYNVVAKKIPRGGLNPSELIGFDLVWLINPGHPIQDSKTKQTLKNFQRSVVLQGDDMAAGNLDLTGLRYKSNGASISCSGRSYKFDNLGGYNYQVSMLEQFLPGIPLNLTFSEYGNDIDHTEVAVNDGKTKVLAVASAPAGTCEISSIPVITVREK